MKYLILNKVYTVKGGIIFYHELSTYAGDNPHAKARELAWIISSQRRTNRGVTITNTSIGFFKTLVTVKLLFW